MDENIVLAAIAVAYLVYLIVQRFRGKLPMPPHNGRGW